MNKIYQTLYPKGTHYYERSLLEADGAVPHAACSREGGDGGGQHRDDDFNGLFLDERPRLLAQFVEELQDKLFYN